MTVRARVDALERAVAKVQLRGRNSCDVCGRFGGYGMPWAEGPEEHGECPACGLIVDAEGVALGVPGPDGRLNFKWYGWGDPLANEDGEVILAPEVTA